MKMEGDYDIFFFFFLSFFFFSFLLYFLEQFGEYIFSSLGLVLCSSVLVEKGASSCHFLTTWVIILHALEI